tara:strand:+ start:58 stop:246 length:189 start_codon:yes stop_codon:yes gene_type:complete
MFDMGWLFGWPLQQQGEEVVRFDGTFMCVCCSISLELPEVLRPKFGNNKPKMLSHFRACDMV